MPIKGPRAIGTISRRLAATISFVVFVFNWKRDIAAQRPWGSTANYGKWPAAGSTIHI